MLMPVQTMKDQLLPVTKALLYILIEIQKMHVSSTKYHRSLYTVDLKNFKAGLDKLTHKICDTSAFGSAWTLYSECEVNRSSDPQDCNPNAWHNALLTAQCNE